MEAVLSGKFDDVFVARNTGSFEGFAGELLLLERDEMDAAGELIDGCLLAAKIVDFELGVGDSTAISRLDVRLILTVSVATSRTCSNKHYR